MAPIPDQASVSPPDSRFSVSHQKVDLEIDLLSRSVKGRTELTINPQSKDLKIIRMNCRQIKLKRLFMNGKPVPSVRYEDVYDRARLPWRAGVRHYPMLQARLEKSM